MSSPLPKVYEDSGNGTAQPIATTQGLSGAIGGDFKGDELQRVSKETVGFSWLSVCSQQSFLCRSDTFAAIDAVLSVAGQEAGSRSTGTYAKMDHSIQHCPGTHEQTGGC